MADHDWVDDYAAARLVEHWRLNGTQDGAGRQRIATAARKRWQALRSELPQN